MMITSQKIMHFLKTRMQFCCWLVLIMLSVLGFSPLDAMVGSSQEIDKQNRAFLTLVQSVVRIEYDYYEKNESVCAAVHATNQELVKIQQMLDSGININVRDGDTGNTALHWAALYKHYQLAYLLVKNGANIEALNYLGETPLKKSIANLSNIAQLLLFYGASFSHRPDSCVNLFLMDRVYKAAAYNDTDMLLENLAPASSPEALSRPLAIACSQGSADCAKILLQRQARPYEALQVLAVVKKRLNILGQNKSSMDKWQRIHAPLQDQLLAASQSLQNAIIERQSNLRMGSFLGILPREIQSEIHNCFVYGQTEIEPKRMERNAELWKAVIMGFENVAQNALQAGADPNERNPEGVPSIWLAIFGQRTSFEIMNMVDLLLKYGAHPNSIAVPLDPKQGRTPRYLLEVLHENPRPWYPILRDKLQERLLKK